MKKRSDILRKLEALFARAEEGRGATPAEREACMKKARKLMDEHSISQMDVGTQDGAAGYDPNITESKMATERSPLDYDRFLMWLLTECFDVEMLFSTYQEESKDHNLIDRRMFLIYGEEEDMAMAKFALPIAADTMWRGMLAWSKENGFKGQAPANQRQSFYSGVVQGFLTASAEGRALALKKATKEQKDQFALILVTKKEAITKYIEKNVKVRKGKKSRVSCDNLGAARAGHEAGSQMSLTQKKLSGGRNAISG